MVLAVAVLIVIFVGFFISGAIKNLKDPHGEMIFKVNGTVALSERGVVKPLVGKDQKFDVAVSVWIRARVEEERTWRESLVVGADGEEKKREAEYSILETPLFSDVVFRDLSLSDRHRRVDVPLRIPIAKLYVLSTCWCSDRTRMLSSPTDNDITYSREQNLTLMDLRSSFILIPSSPSPLDRLVNYSRAYNSLGEVPRRSWP